MRPVTRGNPNSYPADYLTGGAQDVARSARRLQRYVDNTDTLGKSANIVADQVELMHGRRPNLKKLDRAEITEQTRLSTITSKRQNLVDKYQAAIGAKLVDPDEVKKT